MMIFTKILSKSVIATDWQDRTNWEHKLEALAHLLSVAEAKRAIATMYGHLDTRYIKATRHMHQAREALD